MPVVYSEQSEGQKLTFYVGIVVDILNCVQAVSDVHCTVSTVIRLLYLLLC